MRRALVNMGVGGGGGEDYLGSGKLSQDTIEACSSKKYEDKILCISHWGMDSWFIGLGMRSWR